MRGLPLFKKAVVITFIIGGISGIVAALAAPTAISEEKADFNGEADTLQEMTRNERSPPNTVRMFLKHYW